MTATAAFRPRVVVVEPRNSLAALIVDRLQSGLGAEALAYSAAELPSSIEDTLANGRDCVVVYSPLNQTALEFTPDADEADKVFRACVRARASKVVLVSSAAAYGADYHNPGLIHESRPAPARRSYEVAEAWRAVEALAAQHAGDAARTRLTILRPAMTLVDGATDWVNRVFRRRWLVTVAGHNPSIQLLSAADLADAIVRAVASDFGGVFNVAPDGVVPLRRALRAAGARAVAIPWTLQWLARIVLRRFRLASSSSQQDRYSWTVCNERSRAVLGVRYGDSSLSVVRSLSAPIATPTRHGSAEPTHHEERSDDFGMDEHFIRVRSQAALRFMDRRYWRIETRGLENVPREGRAVLVGVHRGFMPFDGVMMVHLLEKHVGRIPRFLMHPGLVKFPVLAPFLTNLGGIIACQENADYVLERDEILGVFPEGIRGAFRMYRDAYTLDRFGRSDFVKMALRNAAPIIPFVFLGPAEMFPILGKIEWSWWKRHTEWPFIPITPTFPLLPVPLPTKWHLLILPAIPVQEMYSPADADDAGVVRSIGNEVRDRMQQAISAMRTRRRSIFFGSIFDEVWSLAPIGNPGFVEPRAVASETVAITAS
jgi:1-acyl-sn-glycerol-3-phosphate acyltransferase/nucleoside-diphosphate-sugar epimerase